MIGSRHVACKRMRVAGVAAAVVIVSMLSEAGVYAQACSDLVTTPVGGVNLHRSGKIFGVDSGGEIPGNMRHSLAALDRSTAVALNQIPVRALRASSGGHQRSIGRSVVGGVIGAVGGFFAGGFVGAKMEGTSCRCDDPGLKGFIIGAPIGAVVGGIFGTKFF